MRSSFAPLRAALFSFALVGLATALPSAYAQTTYGPGPGGTLVDGTAALEGVFNTDIVPGSSGLFVQSINSVTLTNFTHTALGDLEIRLTNLNSGSSTVLTSPPDARLSNFNGTYTFSVNAALQTVDEASAGLTTTQDLAPGGYAISSYGGGTANGPRNTFAAFVGAALSGTWRLSITDFAAGNTGTLGSWSFNATTSTVRPMLPTPPTSSPSALNAAGSITGTLGANAINWYSFVYSGTGGFSINTTGSAFDTELGLYNSLGALVATNDDNGASLQSLINSTTGLGAGTYYLALGGFDTTFGATGFNVTSTATGAANTGAFRINGLSAVTGTAAPEPGSVALLALGGLPLAGMVARRSNTLVAWRKSKSA